MDYSQAAEQDRRMMVMLRSHVERCLQDVWSLNDLPVDGDGDFPYRHGTAMCWVSLVGGPVPAVRVFAHSVNGVKRSAKLLAEINDLNQRSRWTKVGYDDGLVRVFTELHWAAVDRIALEQAVRAVGEVADDIGTMVATVYGGNTPFPRLAEQQDQDTDEEAA